MTDYVAEARKLRVSIVQLAQYAPDEVAATAAFVCGRSVLYTHRHCGGYCHFECLDCPAFCHSYGFGSDDRRQCKEKSDPAFRSHQR